MRMCTIHQFLFGLLFFVPLQTYAQEITASSLTGDAGVRLVEKIEHDRGDRIRSLLRVLADAKTDSLEQRLAIHLLGELRAREAIVWLIENIDKVENRSPLSRTISDDYPCIDALGAIGKDASNAALLAIRDAKGKKRRDLLLNVIVRVEGETFAQLRLERELEQPERENTADQKRTLEEVLRNRFLWPDFRLVKPDCWPDRKDDYSHIYH